MVPAMEPCDRAIVRFSFACLALSLIAGLLPVAFPDNGWQDSAERPPEMSPSVADGPSEGGNTQVAQACSAAPSICDGVR